MHANYASNYTGEAGKAEKAGVSNTASFMADAVAKMTRAVRRSQIQQS